MKSNFPFLLFAIAFSVCREMNCFDSFQQLSQPWFIVVMLHSLYSFAVERLALQLDYQF
jgi:hypothetical protein